MKDRPILFNGPMVRALLDGSKTQTRRLLRLPHGLWENSPGCELVPIPATCPYGQPGDQLWVKETTVNVEDHGYVGPVYAESGEGRGVRGYGLSPSPDDMTEVEPEEIKLRPSLFMSRAMSRITLEIVSVRVERLQEISDADCRAEGTPGYEEGVDSPPPDEECSWSYRAAYQRLWESINGPGSWAANPWVWAVEFRRLP